MDCFCSFIIYIVILNTNTAFSLFTETISILTKMDFPCDCSLVLKPNIISTCLCHQSIQFFPCMQRSGLNFPLTLENCAWKGLWNHYFLGLLSLIPPYDLGTPHIFWNIFPANSCMKALIFSKKNELLYFGFSSSCCFQIIFRTRRGKYHLYISSNGKYPSTILY